MAENRVLVTGIQEPPNDWSSRHLADDELLWFDFNPSGLAEFARRYGADVDLADRIMECRRAAWACGSYVQFTETRGRRGNVVTSVVSNDDHSENFQDYGIDIDAEGRVVGVELLHRECHDR